MKKKILITFNKKIALKVFSKIKEYRYNNAKSRSPCGDLVDSKDLKAEG